MNTKCHVGAGKHNIWISISKLRKETCVGIRRQISCHTFWHLVVCVFQSSKSVSWKRLLRSVSLLDDWNTIGNHHGASAVVIPFVFFLLNNNEDDGFLIFVGPYHCGNVFRGGDGLISIGVSRGGSDLR